MLREHTEPIMIVLPRHRMTVTAKRHWESFLTKLSPFFFFKGGLANKLQWILLSSLSMEIVLQ